MADLNTPTSCSTSQGQTVTTNRPELTLSGTLPNTNQQVYGEWQLARNTGFTSSLITVVGTSAITGQYYPTGQVARGQVAGTGTSVIRNQGAWYLRGRYRDNLGQVSSWSPVTTLTINISAPQQQAINEPADNAVYQTNRPTIKATMFQNNNALLTLQYQFATDNAFTANVRSEYATPDGPYNGIIAQPMDDIYLFQAEWYVRIRATDELDQNGPWSVVRKFTITHTPSAVQLFPVGNQYVALTDPIAFVHQFNDPSPDDEQTAYQLQVEQNAGPIPIYESGKVTSGTQNPNVTIPATYKDVVLRWRIRVWDKDDKVSEWRGYELFQVGDKPAVTLSGGVNGTTLPTGRPTFSWSSTFGGGRTQSRYRIVVKRGGATVLDTGDISGRATSWQPDTSIYENQSTYTTTVYVTDSGGLTGSASSTNYVEYSINQSVPFTVDASSFGELGYVEVSWQPSSDVNFRAWRVYRRDETQTKYEVVFETANPVVTSWRDYSPRSLGTYRYFLVQVSDIDGKAIESPAPIVIPDQSIVSEHYWLLDPDDAASHVRLNNVTSDSFTHEIEQAVFTVIGRGRRVEIGTELGYSGTLNAQLRFSSGVGPRAQRLSLERAHAAGKRLVMRTPFGDTIPVSLGNIGTTRIAGVGTTEFVDVSIPYLETY